MSGTSALNVAPIGTQTANTPFTVTGTYQLNSGTWQEQLEYQDDNQTSQTPIAAPSTTLTTTTFTFTHPGLPAGTHTVSVKDPLTGNVFISNSFTVIGASSIAVNTPVSVNTNVAFLLTGTLSGYTTAPSLTYRIDGGTPTTVTTVSTTAFSVTVPGLAAGSHSVIVTDGTVASPTTSFTVTAPATTITPVVPTGVVAGQPFTFQGTLGGYAKAPSLNYHFDNASALPMTGVTQTGWSMQLTAPLTPATHVLAVTDGTTTASISFVVGAAPKQLTAFAPSGVVAGSTFTFTGSLANFSTIPALTYKIDGGAAIAMTGVTINGWAMSITAPAVGSHTITVNDAADSLTSSATFTVTSSAGLTPDTWDSTKSVGGPITLSNNNYTATAGGNATPYSSPSGILSQTPISTTAGEVVVFEVTATTLTQNYTVGVANAAWIASGGGGLGGDANSIGAYPSTGTGSQPPQTVFFNNNQLGAGGTSSANGDIITVAVNGNNFFFSDAAMRATTGVKWNGSTTADPVTNVGGFPFTITAPYYAAFGEGESGGIAVLNDGTSAFSTFLQTYITANPGKTVSLSGQAPSGTKAITPNQPSGIVAGAAFNFSGTLANYTAAPNLTYSVDGGTSAPVTGVTASGWSMTLTIGTTGSHTIAVTDGTVTGSTTFSVSSSGSGTNRIVAPLTGNVAKGTWIFGLKVAQAGLPGNGGFMFYDLLVPANYNANFVYPIVICGHENDEGMNGNTYPGSGLATAVGALGTNLAWDTVVNTVAMRTNYPAFFVVPYCDQTTDTSGATVQDNFGGYADTPGATANAQGVCAIIAALSAQYAIDATRVYGYGCSLGAIGVLSWMVDFNNWGTAAANKSVFTAGVGLSDQLFRPTIPNTTPITAMKNVPYFAIGTPNDNNVQIYDQAAWTQYTGNTSYPTPANYSSGGVAACNAPGTKYYFINTTVDVPWNQGYIQLNADGGIATPIFTWLFSQISGGSAATIDITGVSLSATQGQPNSPVGTSVGTLSATATGGTLTGTSFSITSQSTAGAFKLSGATVQFASASVAVGTYTLNIQVIAGNAVNSPQTYPVTINVAAGVGFFKVSQTGTYASLNDPSGNRWKGRGIAMWDGDVTPSTVNASGAPVTTAFPTPKFNVVRVACFSYQNASAYQTFINQMTALGVVVILENHQNFAGNSGGGQGVVFTGQTLATESAWYAQLASAFSGNPYVWFGTNNEPSVNPSVAALSTWHQATYNAIRNTGNKNPILLDINNPYTWGSGGGMTPSVYAAMTNVMWDMHSYDWLYSDPGSSSGYSQNLSVIQAGIQTNVQLLQTITSADGKIPVFCAEYGNSTTGQGIDPGGTQNNEGIQNQTDAGMIVGCCAWIWNANNAGQDDLGNGSGLTAMGQQVQAWIASSP